MSEDGNPHYDNTHRALLQAFLARSVIPFEETKPLLAAILTAQEKREVLPGDVTDADVTNYVGTLNTALSPLDLEIRDARSQLDRSAHLLALVNSVSDPLTQLATTYSADELAFIKRLLDAMFETNNTPRAEVMAVTSMQAVRLHKAPAGAGAANGGGETQGSGGQSITMQQAERVLSRLVEEKWLEKSEAAYYSLSPRALMELRGWLVETYNDDDDQEQVQDEGRWQPIKFCHACREIVTVGQRCANRDCVCRVHSICTANFFRVQRSRACPLCSTEWTGQDYVGERAARGAARSKTSAAGPSRRKTGRQTVEGNGEEDGEA